MIAFSSCNVLNDPARFRYLNKVSVNTPDPEITNTIIAGNYQRSESVQTERMAVHHADSVDSNINSGNGILETIRTVQTSYSPEKTNIAIPEKAKQNIQQRPVYAQKGNLCSAKTCDEKHSTDKNIFAYIVMALGTLIGASMVWGLPGAIAALGIIGAALIIGLILYSVFSSKKEKKSTPDNNSAFIDGETTEPQKETTHTTREKPTRRFQWVVAATVAGLLVLTAIYGFGVLLLALMFALVIAFIAGSISLIIWLVKVINA